LSRGTGRSKEGEEPGGGRAVHDLGLRDYLQILSRRKWIVLQALIIVPLAAVAFSLRQSSVYQSSADVLLRFQSLPSTLSGISDPNSYSYYIDPTRSIGTSLQVAGLPVLNDRVAAALKKRGVPAGDVPATSVAEVGTTDVIRFSANSGNAAIAAAVATEYARQFTLYYEQLDTGAIGQAIRGLRNRIAELRADGTTQGRKDAAALQSKVNQLETLRTLQTSSAVVVRPASPGAKIRPTPKKYGFIGIGLGLVLGIGLAFLRDAFDTRLRTGSDIAGILGVPVLGRIPPPKKRLDRERQLVMLADASGVGADAFRRLRMNLEFAAIGKQAQTIMVTSAVAAEGKTTTFANLAVAMALGGKNVALVDLDLHRPMIGRFFRVPEDQPGLSAVVLGHATIDQAVVPINLEDRLLEPGAGGRRSAGSLVVLPTGILPPDPGEFVGLEGVRHVIGALRDRYDVVLIDAPPLLAIGDGLTIAGFSDAVVAVVRADFARRGIMHELAATLEKVPPAKLGVVVCGDAGLDDPQYGAQYGYAYARERDWSGR
jgi:capsular exopolysaccharide synthesis family protein